MNEPDQEQQRVRRRLQLNAIEGLVGRSLMRNQLFLVMLVDGVEGGGDWSMATNATTPITIRMLEVMLADQKGKEVVDPDAEPGPDTLSKLQVQYRKLSVHPTEVVRQQLRHALEAVARAVLKGDLIAEATLLIFLAGCAMVLYRRSLVAFIESRRAKGGTS